MKSLRLRSAIIASIASMLICTMLLGSVLISNVYAKGSGSEKSRYNLEENCMDDHKGTDITLTGSRSVTQSDTTSDNDAKVDKNAQKAIDNPDGDLGRVSTDFNALGEPVNPRAPDGTLGVFKNDKHIELPSTFDSFNNETGEHKILALNPTSDVKQKSTQELRKVYP